MIWKYFLCSTFVGLAITGYVEESSYIHKDDNNKPYNELPCLVIGGTCAQSNDCSKITEKGLCPKQESNGVACCFDNDQKPYNELPCMSAGGMCMQSYDCPGGYRAQTKGLCPVQQESGVECCYAIPLSETRCRKNGGECMPKSDQCPEFLIVNRASDCAHDEKCCVLVH